MEDSHIKTLEITNFKCFRSLKLDGIKKINLIGGKNNIGKTALLEAIKINSSSINVYELIYHIHSMLKGRQGYNKENNDINIDFIYKNANFMKIDSNLRTCLIKFGDLVKNSILNSEYNFFNMNMIFSINKEIENLLITDFMKVRKNYEGQTQYINYINPTRIQDVKLAILYGSLVDLDREKYLDQSLSIFDNNIIGMKQKATDTGIIIKLKLKNQRSLVLLSSLGDGVKRYIAILCAIWANKDGFLFIDEIENGIHYSNYQKLWHLIFQASKEANCQIFATTHSKECIESYGKAAKNLNDRDISFTTLVKDKQEKIHAITHNYDLFINNLEQNHEVRGW